MKDHHVNILVDIARGLKKTIENPRYLELGVWKARCFNSVAPYFFEAIGVDVKQSNKYITVNHKFYRTSTVDYFKKYYDGKLFNLIFIDACHEFENVKVDFKNSYNSIVDNGLIVLHDTYPANEGEFKGCKDAYKIVDWIKTNNFNGEQATLPFYFGLTIFRKCSKQLLWM
jgi:hypothetical protein